MNRSIENCLNRCIMCLLAAVCLLASSYVAAAGPVLPIATGSDNLAGPLPVSAAPIRMRGYRADFDAGVFIVSGSDGMAAVATLDLRMPYMTGWPNTQKGGDTLHWGFMINPSVKADFGYVLLGDDPQIMRIRAEAAGLGILRRHFVSRDTALGTVVSPEYSRLRSMGLTRTVRGSRRARLQAIMDRCGQPNPLAICAELGELSEVRHVVGRPHSTSEWIFGHVGFLYEDDRALGIKNMAIVLDTVVWSAHKALNLGGLRVELCGAAKPAGWYVSLGDSEMAFRQGGNLTFRIAAEVCAGVMLGSVGTLRNTVSLEYMTATATATTTEDGGERVKSTGELTSFRFFNTLSIERIGNIPIGLFYRLEMPDVTAKIADTNNKSYTAHVAGLRGTF